MKRIVEPEFLDSLPSDDPRAIRSRRDLRRINAWMGNAGIMANALKENCPGATRQITEFGAGDGHFLLQIARKLNWQNVSATLLDRQKIISSESLATFSKFGWRADVLVADVFDWAQDSEVIVANLFLHHFKDARLTELLRLISQSAKVFVAVEPHRFTFPFLCGQLLRFIGCNSITRHDAVVSIRAGFVHDEISGLWPDKKNWRLTERRAGLFSHLFVAKKIL